MSLAMIQSAPAAPPRRLRELAIAIGSGIALIVVGEGIWVSLIAAYSRHPTPFPWFVPAMALVLALVAGWSTFFAGAGAYVAYRMTSGLGGEVPMTIPPGPKTAIIAGLAMAAIVAGVLEEVSVRGFIQGRLEKSFGVVPAILVSGVVWALFHTNHSYFQTTPFDVAVWFGIFLVVSAMLGTVAHVTNSVLPGIVIHAGFDSTYFISAGLLQPKIAPLAYLESLASPQTFLIAGAGLAVVALVSWIALFRSVRAAR